MPKEIKTAADMLGEAASETGANAPEVVAQEPAVVAAEAEKVAAEAPTDVAGGFELPPPVVDEAPKPESRLTAAQLLTGSGSLDQQAPPPSAPVPTQAKEAVIPARPETIAPTETEVIEPKVAVVPAPKKIWRFVKNVHFGEKIFLKDKTQFVYASPSFSVGDPELAAKILEVASIYNIVEQ